MTGTAIIDGAIRAGCICYDSQTPCIYPECRDCSVAISIRIALRAANPWEPAAEEIEAMARAAYEAGGYGVWQFVQETYRAISLATYRARPIMRELYPEKFDG